MAYRNIEVQRQKDRERYQRRRVRALMHKKKKYWANPEAARQHQNEQRARRLSGEVAARQPSALTDVLATTAIAAYANGATTHQIAAELGIPQNCIHRQFVRRNVAMRSPGARRLYTLDHAVFDQVTPESAYWIGFIMADGCISPRGHTASLALHNRDTQHLYKLRALLKTDAPVRTVHYDNGSFGNAPMCRFEVNSKQIETALASFGIVPRKSQAAKVIGLEDNRDFWRGVVDGDGFISFAPSRPDFPVLGCTGSFDLMTQFSNFVRRSTGYPANVRPMHSIFNVRINGSGASIVAKLLYDGCAVALDRKNALAQRAISRVWKRRSVIKWDRSAFRWPKS